MTPLLVVGYGNELRGDDGVGPVAARTVAAWNRPDVRGIDMHQLTPELAAELSHAERVVFVDAQAASPPVIDRGLNWRPIDMETGPATCCHVCSPGWLLWITRVLYGHGPEAWLATIPIKSLDYESSLTPYAERGVAALLRWLARLVPAVPSDAARSGSVSAGPPKPSSNLPVRAIIRPPPGP